MRISHGDLKATNLLWDAGRILLIDAADNGRGQFRILIEPDESAGPSGTWPAAHYLRQGVRANGWVLLNRVRLGYEVWRQFNGFPPTIAASEPWQPADKDSRDKKERK